MLLSIVLGAVLLVALVLIYLVHVSITHKPLLKAIDPMLDNGLWYLGIFEAERVSPERRKYYEDNRRFHDVYLTRAESARSRRIAS